MLCASLPPACTPLHSLLFWLTACRCVTEVVPTVADPAQLCQSWEVPDSCSQDFGAKDQKAPPHPRSAHSLRSGMRFSLICLLFSNCGTGGLDGKCFVGCLVQGHLFLLGIRRGRAPCSDGSWGLGVCFWWDKGILNKPIGMAPYTAPSPSTNPWSLCSTRLLLSADPSPIARNTRLSRTHFL